MAKGRSCNPALPLWNPIRPCCPKKCCPTGPTGSTGPTGPTGPVFDLFFSAKNNADMIVPTGATGPTGSSPILLFPTVIDNVGGAYNGTDTFTAPADGLYFFDASVIFSSNVNTDVKFRLIRNGATIDASWLMVETSEFSRTHTAEITKQLVLTAGDTLYIQAFNDAPQPLTIIGTGLDVSQFEGRRVE